MRNAFAKTLLLFSIVTGIEAVSATPIFVDELALSVVRGEFVKRFPSAKQLSQKENPARETLAVPSPGKLSVGKHEIRNILRTFVGNVSCAGGAGFGSMSTVDARALLGLLKGRHERLISEVKAHDGQLSWTFMEDADARVGILLKKEDEDGRRLVITYAVVLNSCPPVVAREYQVIPPQK